MRWLGYEGMKCFAQITCSWEGSQAETPSLLTPALDFVFPTSLTWRYFLTIPTSYCEMNFDLTYIFGTLFCLQSSFSGFVRWVEQVCRASYKICGIQHKMQMGGGWGRRGLKKEGIVYTYAWFTLLYGRNQRHCKAITFQLKKKSSLLILKQLNILRPW